MNNEIIKIQNGSIGEEIGLEIGDKLISINNTEIKDIIDYKYMMADEFISIDIEKANGEIWSIDIEKEYDEQLGLEFKDVIMDKASSCNNKCIFCFIDQMPAGMRDTLYFKDDDSRLSFLQGNFVTLTNMSDEDIDRIINYRISPINVSVHTTNPELRVKMLNNRFAGNVYKILKRLSNANIDINCQIVLCPDINDNEELINTIEDLYSLYPSIKNVAVVPVGITKFREGLFDLKIYDKEGAKNQIQLVDKLQQKYLKEKGTPFVRMSDEFYILAQQDVPKEEFYNEFEQLEDGIGMIRFFRNNIERNLINLKKNIKGELSIVTGVSAYDEVKSAATNIIETNSNLNIQVHKIINDYFGETITVSGLITATDIVNQLKGKDLGEYVIIPDNMLRRGYELSQSKERVFLDDMTVDDLENLLQTRILVSDYSGEDLIDIINKNGREE